MKLGSEVLFEKHLDLLRGKRIGLITNPTGTDHELRSSVERFRSHPEVRLVALYGPEHGVRGNAQAGEYVPFYFDEQLQLPVFSLYGQSQKPSANLLTNLDQAMRSYDTHSEGKSAEPGMLSNVELLVFDLQDVGTRVYTYLSTMALAMEAAAAAGIPFIVLDRPNPINGTRLEGPVLEHPRYSSFIGLYPIPLRHGLTAGELARLINEKHLSTRVTLTVIPMEHWRRSQWFDDTGLAWVPPSPNLPTLESATVYPGQVMLEGTNLSEGRGTTKPFELFGAPWIDGYVLARELNQLQLPGVTFREAWFTPTFSKFKGERCGGCQLHVTDRNAYLSVATTLAVLQTVQRLYGDQLEWHGDYFDRVMGTARVREGLQQGRPFREIVSDWDSGLAEFDRRRRPFLLYP